jgi:hypothetical protein
VGRVLIWEPHADIKALLELVVRRLGHEPVGFEPALDLGTVDVAVIEPGEPEGMRLAIRVHDHGTPIIFTSIFPPDDASRALEPTAYLVKPFPLYRLEEAIADALGRSSRFCPGKTVDTPSACLFSPAPDRGAAPGLPAGGAFLRPRRNRLHEGTT